MANARGSGDEFLVMGASWGLDPQTLWPFYASLYESGFGGKTVIFAAHYTPQQIEDLRAFVDVVVMTDADYAPCGPVPLYRFVKWTKGVRVVRKAHRFVFQLACMMGRDWSANARSLEYFVNGLQSLRYAEYRNYLDDADPSVRRVLISDLRDAVFQANPEECCNAEELDIFLEHPSMRFSRGGHNEMWFRDLFGHAATNELADQIVSCSGVTGGAIGPMRYYLARMEALLTGRPRPLGPRDQAAHNFLVRSPGLAAEHRAYGESWVITVSSEVEPQLDAAGRVVNRDGSVVTVVHQYDRNRPLTAGFEQRFGRRPR